MSPILLDNVLTYASTMSNAFKSLAEIMSAEVKRNESFSLTAALVEMCSPVISIFQFTEPEVALTEGASTEVTLTERGLIKRPSVEFHHNEGKIMLSFRLFFDVYRLTILLV
jgi:hypothetical protein